MRRLRTSFALSGALIAAALIATPAGAYEVITDTGKTGEYTSNDGTGSPGVLCRFENHAQDVKDEIDRIRIKRVWTHGFYPQKTWVGFQFQIKANRPPHDDNVFRTVFTSPIRKAKANQTEIADFAATWVAPENSRARYRVHILFYYYKPGTMNQVKGRVRLLNGFYRHKISGEVPYDLPAADGAPEWCRRNYHGL